MGGGDGIGAQGDDIDALAILGVEPFDDGAADAASLSIDDAYGFHWCVPFPNKLPSTNGIF